MAQSPAPHAPQPGQRTPTTQAGDAAHDLKEQVQETAGQATEQVKHTVQSLLGAQKGRTTQSLHTLADTLHQTGDQLRESEGGAFFAPYVDRASERVRRFSGHLDEREVSELVADLERYARTQPAMFLGGAFALGALVTRFLRSSGQRESSDDIGSGRPGPARDTRRVASPAIPSPQRPSPPSPRPVTPPVRDTRQPGGAPSSTPVAKQGTAPTPGSTPAMDGGPRQPAAPPAPPASGTEHRTDVRPGNPATKQGAAPGPGTTAPGGSGVRQPATPATGTAPRADVRQGAGSPPQPAPLLPPDLDPRPGQRDPRKPQP